MKKYTNHGKRSWASWFHEYVYEAYLNSEKEKGLNVGF